jgi:hypothetical protein
MDDFRAYPEQQLQTAIFYTVRDLAPGTAHTLLFSCDPTLALRSVNLQLRSNLRWSLETRPDGWLAVLHRTEDVPASDALDALNRDHKRLDALFSQVIHLTDRGQLAAASAVMTDFGQSLRRHMDAEHRLLVAAIPTPANAQGFDPSAAMLAEHQEILAQTVMIELAFEEPDAGTASISPLLAILAGYLSKHELREESVMFPIWRGALARAGETAQHSLLEKTLAALAG